MTEQQLKNKAKLQTLTRKVDPENNIITWFDHKLNAVHTFAGKKGEVLASDAEKDWLIEQLGEEGAEEFQD